MTTTETGTTAHRSLLAAVRDELRARRAERAAARQLEAELASYTTAHEIDDLMATLDRYDGPDASAIRGILARNAA